MSAPVIALRPPARPVERIPGGARVVVLIESSGVERVALAGAVSGYSFVQPPRYDVDLDLDGMKLIGVPAALIQRLPA